MPALKHNQTSQLIENLEVAVMWMILLDVDVDQGRLAAYRTMKHKWDDFISGRGKLGVRELAPIVSTFAWEVPAFIAIHRAFSATPRDELARLVVLLTQATQGAVRIDAVRSRGAHPARDALFEALTAAYFQQGAGKVLFGDSGAAGFALGRHHIHLASGRLLPEGDIAASVTAACAKLLVSFDGRQGPRSRGLVALDASALITPPGQAPPTQERAAMDDAADQQLANFIDTHMDVFQNVLHVMDRRIIGIMLLSTSVAVALDDGAFVPVGRWVLVWRENINISDFDLLDRLRGLLRGER